MRPPQGCAEDPGAYLSWAAGVGGDGAGEGGEEEQEKLFRCSVALRESPCTLSGHVTKCVFVLQMLSVPSLRAPPTSPGVLGWPTVALCCSPKGRFPEIPAAPDRSVLPPSAAGARAVGPCFHRRPGERPRGWARLPDPDLPLFPAASRFSPGGANLLSPRCFWARKGRMVTWASHAVSLCTCVWEKRGELKSSLWPPPFGSQTCDMGTVRV